MKYLLNNQFVKEKNINKILAFLLIVFFVPVTSHAQFIKGQKLIGGSLFFSGSSGSTTPTAFDNRNVFHVSATGIGVNPIIAKFINAKTLVGAGLIYNYSHYSLMQELPDNGNNYKDLQHSGGINIFSQRFISLGNKFFFTIQTSGSVLCNTGKQADLVSKATIKTKGYAINFALAPGISCQINKRILFDAFLNNLLFAGYQHSATTTNYPLPRETKTHNNSVYISTSLSNTAIGNVGLGFRWLLKNK